jgi:acetyl esterase
VRIVKSVGTFGTLPVVLCVHGGGWVLGNAGTHDPRRVAHPAARAERRPVGAVP